MTPHARCHITETYVAWLVCYNCPPTVTDVCCMTGYPHGMVYAWLWRLREMGLL